MLDAGVVWVAIGEKSMYEALASLNPLREQGQYKTNVIERDYGGVSTKQASRYAKTSLMEWTNHNYFAYLDADTRVRQPIEAGFEILADGCDMVIVPSQNQDSELLWHIDPKEVEAAIEQVGYIPLQLQAGVFFVQRNPRTVKFFRQWREEWLRWGDEDQAAFLRALNKVPRRHARHPPRRPRPSPRRGDERLGRELLRARLLPRLPDPSRTCG